MCVVTTASALAREKKFNEAIELLMEYYGQSLPSDAGLIKVVPYFQKAGRYSELDEICRHTIVPKLEEGNQVCFQHKCLEIRSAFMNLKLHQLYKKLALCAKREKLSSDESEYKKISFYHYKEYGRLLSLGSEIEEKKEYEEAREVFGADTSEWPPALQRRLT